jgi:hypothetical protein
MSRDEQRVEKKGNEGEVLRYCRRSNGRLAMWVSPKGQRARTKRPGKPRYMKPTKEAFYTLSGRAIQAKRWERYVPLKRRAFPEQQGITNQEDRNHHSHGCEELKFDT